jgi:flagellar hook-length control protein FliK
MPDPPSRAVLEQVQSGMLRNLGNGVRRLTLSLNPPELGQIQLVLQVQNKEVQAVIRAGNPEVGRMVSEQIAHLRESLEQQGLRVTRLEVQTQSEQQFGAGSWQGAEGHNRAWEQLRRGGFALRPPTAPAVTEEDAAVLQGRSGPEGLDLFA